MRRLFPSIVLLLLTTFAFRYEAQDLEPLDLRAADAAWNDGNYILALNTYIKLLNSRSGDRYLEPIALQTGELFVSEEVTADGRNPKLSPDGRLIAYETGPAKDPVTRIVRMEGKHAQVADLPGTGAVFSPDSSKVAYLKLPKTEELARAQEALDKAPDAGPERTFAQQTLNRIQQKASRIVVRDLVTQRDTELKTGDLLKSSVVFGADNQTVFFAGAREDDAKRNDVYGISASSLTPAAVTDTEGFKTAPVVAASGKVLVVTIPAQTPFPVPQRPNQRGDGQRGQRGGGGGDPPPPRFGIVDLASHKVTVVTGSSPAFSEDGKFLAYLTTSPVENVLMFLPVEGASTTVLKTADRLAAPVFSPNGKRIAYQKMSREDWEIFLIDTDGKSETRITRDVQHDALPRFISNDRILAASGEPRHRRSFVYDLPSMQQTRLFHNNSIRTIAPEYLWLPVPDSSKVLISAERDGDTVSTERGVYLVDLQRKIGRAELNERLQKNLTSETLLKEFAEKTFQPMSEAVRKVLDGISVHRIYEHEKTLVSFESKHISMPGNRKAIDYITAQFKSFGYEPEQQWFEPRGALGGKSANVLARLSGTENPELIYTVSSHLDSVVAGPGADDDSSGIAAMLEAARVLRGSPMPATIIFAAFTGEESGTLGSREFARIAKAGKWRIAGSLNNDMVGYANDSRLDNTIRYTNAGIRDIQHSAAMNFTRLITYDARYYKGTDAVPLFETFGDILGGIGGYPILSSPHYHQSHDALDTINFQQVAETSKATVATLMYLASTPSPVKDLSVKGTEVAWTASAEKSVRSYLVSHNGRDESVSQPRINLPGLKPGDTVTVKAVDARGRQGWDGARITVPGS